MDSKYSNLSVYEPLVYGFSVIRSAQTKLLFSLEVDCRLHDFPSFTNWHLFLVPFLSCFSVLKSFHRCRKSWPPSAAYAETAAMQRLSLVLFVKFALLSVNHFASIKYHGILHIFIIMMVPSLYACSIQVQ